jgi:hypothetical protein
MGADLWTRSKYARGAAKPLDGFAKCADNCDGRRGVCNACRYEQRKAGWTARKRKAEVIRKRAVQAKWRRRCGGVDPAKHFRDAIERKGSAPLTEAFVGYSVADLRKHLEDRFTCGMSWEAFTAEPEIVVSI